MAKKTYDAIVIGARCAGSPIAMLLAQRGYDVLVVDRATFPSDTNSTHLIHPTGVAALKRWGVLDEVKGTGCPPIDRYVFDFGPLVIQGRPGTDESPVSYCPRRIVLDDILVRAAVAAGAEVREAFTVEEILTEKGAVAGIRGHGRNGKTVTERARIVVGADGWHSKLVQAVQPERYNEKPPLLAAYYAYWSGVELDAGFKVHIRPERAFGALATNDDLALVVGGWPIAEFEANKGDIEGNFLKMFDLAPDFAERIRAGKRETKFAGARLPNFFRKPYGPGWVLVGDAGYIKDSVTAQGIQDAFRDAEAMSIAMDETLTGARTFDDAMRDYHRARDEHALPMFEHTTQMATLAPPPPEVLQVLGAVVGNEDAMDDFARMNAATISPTQFFSPENIGRIMSAAAA